MYSRVLSRVSRSVSQSYRVLSVSRSQPLHSLGLQSPDNLIQVPVNLFCLTINSSSTPRALLFSSIAPKADGKEEAKASGGTESSGQAEAVKQTNESGSGSEVDLSRDENDYAIENFAKDLLDIADTLRRTLLVGKDRFSKVYASKGLDGAVPLLKLLNECLGGADKQLAEVFKKFGVDELDSKHEPCGPDRDVAIPEIQNFGKSLVNVVDNLGKSSAVAKDNFSNIDAFKASNEAVPLLKQLLEAVEMTDKQLNEVFKKFGFEKFDSKHEPYNPERHDAILTFPVSSQPPGTMIAVLKAGYLLNGRIFRRAEVAITRAVDDGDDASDKEESESARTPDVDEQDDASDKKESQSQG